MGAATARRTGPARPARARPRAVPAAARARLVAGRHPHHPRGLLRAPALRAAGAARLRGLAGARAAHRAAAAGADRRPDDRPAGRTARQRRPRQRADARPGARDPRRGGRDAPASRRADPGRRGRCLRAARRRAAGGARRRLAARRGAGRWRRGARRRRRRRLGGGRRWRPRHGGGRDPRGESAGARRRSLAAGAGAGAGAAAARRAQRGALVPCRRPTAQRGVRAFGPDGLPVLVIEDRPEHLLYALPSMRGLGGDVEDGVKFARHHGGVFGADRRARAAGGRPTPRRSAPTSRATCPGCARSPSARRCAPTPTRRTAIS